MEPCHYNNKQQLNLIFAKFLLPKIRIFYQWTRVIPFKKSIFLCYEILIFKNK